MARKKPRTEPPPRWSEPLLAPPSQSEIPGTGDASRGAARPVDRADAEPMRVAPPKPTTSTTPRRFHLAVVRELHTGAGSAESAGASVNYTREPAWIQFEPDGTAVVAVAGGRPVARWDVRASTNDVAGRLLGDYRLLREIGRGGGAARPARRRERDRARARRRRGRDRRDAFRGGDVDRGRAGPALRARTRATVDGGEDEDARRGRDVWLRRLGRRRGRGSRVVRPVHPRGDVRQVRRRRESPENHQDRNRRRREAFVRPRRQTRVHGDAGGRESSLRALERRIRASRSGRHRPAQDRLRERLRLEK